MYAGTIKFANLSTVSVCLPVHTETQKKRTHTQATPKTQANTCPVMIENHSFVLKEGNTIAHTSRYSLHLRHALESVGRHRRDTLKRKTQVAALRGAGARAHERRTGVVAAEGAPAKGFCPWTETIPWALGREEMSSRCLGL